MCKTRKFVTAVLHRKPGLLCDKKCYCFHDFRGFCYFNSIAIAAKQLKEKLKMKKVLIVDWVRFFFMSISFEHSFHNILSLTTMKKMPFESIVGKGGNPGNTHFLFFHCCYFILSKVTFESHLVIVCLCLNLKKG